MSFVEALYDATYPKKNNKSKVFKSWYKKLQDVSLNNFKDIEDSLDISMNIYKNKKHFVYKTSNLKTKHANLILSNDNRFKSVIHY